MYFVSLILIGNYILFNLFLAILLSAFSNEPPQDQAEMEDVLFKKEIELFREYHKKSYEESTVVDPVNKEALEHGADT